MEVNLRIKEVRAIVNVLKAIRDHDAKIEIVINFFIILETKIAKIVIENYSFEKRT